jgi:hypothetical protein
VISLWAVVSALTQLRHNKGGKDILNRISHLLLAAAVAGFICQAQTQVNLQTQARNIDFSQAPSTKPFKVGAALPATCEVGETFFNTSAAAGANWYGCVAANVWAVQSGTNSGALSAASPVTISPAGVIACSTCSTATINSGSQYNLAYYSASGSGTTVSGLSNGTAKQILVAGSPDNYIDYPDVKVVPTAVCNAGAAGPAWTIPSLGGFSVACRAGTNNLLGALQGTPSSGATAYFDFELPGDWDTTHQPYVQIFYGSGSNTSGTVIFTVSTACMGAEAGATTDDPAFNANSAFSTQTMATANRAWAVSGQLTAVTSGNNCDAGSNMIVKVVLSGTASSAINVYKATVTVPRLLTVQAN